MTFDVNNGNSLVDFMLDHELPIAGRSLDEISREIQPYLSERARSFVKDDSFWEDFAHRCGEQGIALKL